MKEIHRYRTHSIDLELIEVRTGLFRWIYQIDASHSGRSTELLQDKVNSRADALLLAQLEIDQFEEIATAADASSHGFVARATGGHVTIVGRYAWGNGDERTVPKAGRRRPLSRATDALDRDKSESATARQPTGDMT